MRRLAGAIACFAVGYAGLAIWQNATPEVAMAAWSILWRVGLLTVAAVVLVKAVLAALLWPVEHPLEDEDAR